MRVEIIDYTKDALELLLFTKQTRLSQTAGLLEEIKSWPEEKKMQELQYMRGTIQSSWEFCNFTFNIEGVSRAFTHQLVRTRSGHYAQQSQRTVNMEGFDYIIPEKFEKDPLYVDGHYYEKYMENINGFYQHLIDLGVNPQDARGILPTNISTNIIASFNLRTLADMAKVRLCSRSQGEYQNVFREMRKKIIEIYPWCENFIRVYCAAVGTCCFPNYKECPIKPPIFNPDTSLRWDNDSSKLPATREAIQKDWEIMKFEAIPS